MAFFLNQINYRIKTCHIAPFSGILFIYNRDMDTKPDRDTDKDTIGTGTWTKNGQGHG